jgi:hypothetical protein
MLFFFSHLMHYIFLYFMMVFNLLITSILLVFFFNDTAVAVLNTKLLSPSANVHVDVVNHVAQSMDAHAQQFNQNWRDYTIVFLVIIVIGTSILTCCVVTVICLYRRLLFQLLRHGSTAGAHPSAPAPFIIT